MGLFSSAIKEQIDQIAAKSTEQLKKADNINTKSMNDDLNNMSKQVIEYFKDSPAILITSKDELHDYVDKCVKYGYAGIDTETTGLDRLNDWIVGASLYVPGEPECYIPMKHLVPIFETPYKNQLGYEEVAEEFQRLVDGNVKLIFANADFDLAMIYHSLKVDLIPAFYYDVIGAWRSLKENEHDNALKVLYAKYVMKGKADPKKFSDFFSPKLFPYCKPEVAKLYAANDAKITYELFLWQLPFITPDNEKCKKNHLEKIANLIWNIEFPMIKVCAMLHRRGIYLDDSISGLLHERYTAALHQDEAELAKMVQELIDEKDIASNRSRPFATGRDFNPNSGPHVKYLVNKLLGSTATKMDKEALKAINKPATSQILKVRGDVKLLGTYVDKMPKVMGKDHRVHSTFKHTGADTGRMCIAKGEKICTPQGYVEIQNLKSGDEVFCFSKDTKTIQVSTVVNTWRTGENKKCLQIGFGDLTLKCTPEHPILVDCMSCSNPILAEGLEWVPAKYLKLGDVVYYLDEDKIELLTIDSIEELEECYDVYDIEVQGYHNFFASGICVHNSSESPNAQNIPSHALDIRHMFRATPEYTEVIKCEQVDNTVILQLSIYDSVPTLEGRKQVKQLCERDVVILKEGALEVPFMIVSIEQQLGKATLNLRKEA